MSIKASGFIRKAIGNLASIHVIDMQSQNQQTAVHAQTERLHSLRTGWLLLSSIASLRACDQLCGFLVENIQHPSHNTQRASAFDNQGL